MKIYGVSDIHGYLPPEPPADAKVLIIAGDICPDFSPKGAARQWSYVDKDGDQQAAWIDKYLSPWLNSQANKGIEVIAVWGNHDFVGEKKDYRHINWHLLQDESLKINDVTFYGTSWVPGLPYWAFYGPNDFLEKRFARIPSVDVLISHGPPYGAGDFIPTSQIQQEKYHNYVGERVGSKALQTAIETRGIKTTICGHIHEDRGLHSLGLPSKGQSVYNVTAILPDYSGLRQDSWVEIKL